MTATPTLSQAHYAHVRKKFSPLIEGFSKRGHKVTKKNPYLQIFILFFSFIHNYSAKICKCQIIFVPLLAIIIAYMTGLRHRILSSTLFFFCTFCAVSVYGNTRRDTLSHNLYQGFSGGMMLHTGYLFGPDQTAPTAPDGRSYSPQGALFGIGGALRVHLWERFRTGFEGFVSTMYSGMMDRKDLLQQGSYLRVGCGGVLADACWRMEKTWPYMGAAMGGGAMRSLYLTEGDQYAWAVKDNTYFHKQAFFYVTPYIGCDYCLTQKVHLTFRADWMIAIHEGVLALPTGPRIYVGFMFCH